MQGKKLQFIVSVVMLTVLVLGSFSVAFAQTPAPAAGDQPAWGADVMPAVDKAQVAEAIKKEGSKLIVSGFASGEVRSHYHPLWFQEWVRDRLRCAHPGPIRPGRGRSDHGAAQGPQRGRRRPRSTSWPPRTCSSTRSSRRGLVETDTSSTRR